MSTIIEHFILFKFNPNTPPSNSQAMTSQINGLISIGQVLTIAVGPLRRLKSISPNLHFTHFLHSRYASKPDLAAYAAHPAHLSVVVLNAPLVVDAVALDWLAPDLRGSAVRAAVLRLKQGLGEEAKAAVLDGIRGLEERLAGGGGVGQL